MYSFKNENDSNYLKKNIQDDQYINNSQSLFTKILNKNKLKDNESDSAINTS